MVGRYVYHIKFMLLPSPSNAVPLCW